MALLACHLTLLLLFLGSTLADIKRKTNLPPVDKYGCKEVCNADFDVVFIIDKSGSISASEYAQFVNAMELLVDAFTVSPARSHIGSVFFSTNAALGFLLDKHADAAGVKSNLLVNTGGFTNIAGGLELARAVVLEGSNTNAATTVKGDRPNVPNLCFLFSDGEPNRRTSDTQHQADLLKPICTVISVGIGLRASSEQLMRNLSSDNKAYFVSSFGELEADVKQIISLACPTDDEPMDCVTKDIAKWTFFDGNNKDWYVELSTEGPNNPIRKTLARKFWHPDPYDNYGGFAPGDADNKYTLYFRPSNCTFRLSYLEGQFQSHSPNQGVAVVAFDKNNAAISSLQWSLSITVAGQFQDFYLDFQDQIVSKVEFTFSDACSNAPCSGINALHGQYTKCCPVEVDCSELCCHNGGTPRAGEDGCCQCACPKGFRGPFCEVVYVRKDLAKWTYFQGTNKNWQVKMSSVAKGHPIRKSLARTFLWNNDPFDNYASFSSADASPKYTIQFNKAGTYKLHSLRGQYTSVCSGILTINAYDKEGNVVKNEYLPAYNTGYRKYLNFSVNYEVNGEAQVVDRIVIAFDVKCDVWGLNDIYGSYTMCQAAEPNCCCQNGGTPALGEYGCCQCCCPDGFSGDFCQYASQLKEVAKWTYYSGKNKDWYVQLSSEHPDLPVRKTLKRTFIYNNDPYDQKGGFNAGDPDTTYDLYFRGDAVYKVHFFEMEFFTVVANEKVLVTAFNGADEVETWEVLLTTVGSYQYWSINLGSLEVTRLNFDFSAPCVSFPCFGINAFYANYTKCTETPLQCCCQNGGAAALDASGCCSCNCEVGYTGEFCEKSSKDGVIAKWTYSGGYNPHYALSMTSQHPDHPLQKSLIRKLLYITDDFDNYAGFGFADKDPAPKYTINFNRDGCVYKFNNLQGEFTTPQGGQIATWTAYDCNGNSIMDWDIMLQTTGPREYKPWQINLAGVELCKLEMSLSFACHAYPCFGINALMGEFTAVCKEAPDCCCRNGGNATVTETGCCACNCPAPYSGEFCEIETVKKVIAKYTYFDGTNKYWDVSMSSIDDAHPIRKTLRRKRQEDVYDNYGGFAVGDPNPTYTLFFIGDGITKLQDLQGSFVTAFANQHVTITAYNGDVDVFETVINLNGGKNYQLWEINFGDIEVTRVEFVFSSACDCNGCYGINDLLGSFLRSFESTMKCDNVDCDENSTAQYLHGCCRCVTDQKVTCKNKLDVALIVDRSGSIGNYYDTLKQFVKDVIKRFDNDETRFGAVIYDSAVTVEFYMDSFSSLGEYEAAVDAFSGPGGTTNIAGALETTRLEILQESRGDRQNVSNVCLLITDGRPNVRVSDTINQADLLKAHCTVVTLGIGSGVNQALLTNIATGGRYIPVADFDALKMELDNLVTVACTTEPV